MPPRVLVLGAGLISPPLLRYLLSHTDYQLTVGALDVTKATAILAGQPRGRVVQIDIDDLAALAPLVDEADVVVSLLPAGFNPRIAELAIARRIPMLNTSYVSPALAALDQPARDAGVLLLCEIGLDPGIDHMSAVRVVRQVQAEGGAVEQFVSCCGGFPAPDANTNPWGYKFSWFPRQVLLSARNPARYLQCGQVVDVPGAELFAHVRPHAIEGLGVFEIYPNRDSLAYRDLYGLTGATDMLRATLRYPGWCDTLRAAANLGLLDVDVHDWPAGTDYAAVTTRRLSPGGGTTIDRLAAHLGVGTDASVLARFEWAGLLSDRKLPVRQAAPLDLFVGRLAELMTYQPGERDMVVMEHRLTASFPDGHREIITSTLEATGEPFGDSAMSRAVSLPLAIATRLVLAGAINTAGVQIPVQPEIYQPVLDELATLGLALHERRKAAN